MKFFIILFVNVCIFFKVKSADLTDAAYVLPGQGTAFMYFTTIKNDEEKNETIAIISDFGSMGGGAQKFVSFANAELLILQRKILLDETADEPRSRLETPLFLVEENQKSSGASQSSSVRRLRESGDSPEKHKTDNSIVHAGQEKENTNPDASSKKEEGHKKQINISDMSCSTSINNSPEKKAPEDDAEKEDKFTAQRYKAPLELEEIITKKFQYHNPQKIVCFSTHSDEDHNNLYDLLPDGIPTMFIIGNNWSHDKKKFFNINKANSKRVILEIPKLVVNKNFCEAFFTQYQQEFKDQGFSKKMIDQLSFIHIWGINLCSGSSNDNSMLLSIYARALDTVFFFTGDATEKTFTALENQALNLIPSEILRQQYPDALIAAFVPHHGSETTYCDKFMEMTQPDYCIITAGIGRQYGHPRISVVEKLYEKLAGSEKFWKKMNISRPTRFLAFKKDTTKKTTDGRIPDEYYQPISKGLFPKNSSILCTNISGLLIFEKDGVYQSFDPTIKIDNVEYDIEYACHQYEAVDIKQEDIDPLEKKFSYKQVKKINEKVINESSRFIGYDQNEKPVAIFIQVEKNKWYGYSLVQQESSEQQHSFKKNTTTGAINE